MQSNTTYRFFQLITVLIWTDGTKNNPNDNEDSSYSSFGLWKDSVEHIPLPNSPLKFNQD